MSENDEAPTRIRLPHLSESWSRDLLKRAFALPHGQYGRIASVVENGKDRETSTRNEPDLTTARRRG